MRGDESISRYGNGIGVLKNLPKTRLVLLTLLVALIAVGLVGWFGVGYPGVTGYTSYETALPVGFDLSDAEQALVGRSYWVEVDYPPEPYLNPSLNTKGSPRNNGVTYVSIWVDEQSNLIEVYGRREVYVTPYEVLQDLHELGRENQRVAEGDVRDVLDVVGLPSTGEFTFSDDIDSLDYLLPSMEAYFLLFIHLPAVILLTVATLFLKGTEGAPLRRTDSPVEKDQD